MTTEMKPSNGKGGAPPGNKNAVRHGLTTGKLPVGCGWVATLTNHLRTALENAVIAAHGEITLYEAAVINTAIRWERHAMLAQRWLRITADLTIDQKLAFHREVARASTERDKCLKELGLHASESRGIIDALYSTPDSSLDEPAQSPIPPVNDSQTGNPASTEGHTEEAQHGRTADPSNPPV